MHPEDGTEKNTPRRIVTNPERAPSATLHNEHKKDHSYQQSHRDQTEGMKRLKSHPRGREGRAPNRDRHKGLRRPGASIHLRGRAQMEGDLEEIRIDRSPVPMRWVIHRT